MLRMLSIGLLCTTLLLGCAKEEKQAEEVNKTGGTEKFKMPDLPSDPIKKKFNPVPVPIVDGKIEISPENTKIGFTGFHTKPSPDPNPQVGGFTKFKGTLTFEGTNLKSAQIEIDATSLFTKDPKLTDHLNGADFLDTRQFPTITFESTATTRRDNVGTITGNLTIVGKSKEFMIPGAVTATGEGYTFSTEFDFDRTEFGVDKLTDKVEKMVKLRIVVGEKTEAQE